MNSSPKILISALRKEKTRRAPFWFMRQAGRYLPEYKALRSKSPNFLSFCYNPEMAAEATLQPIRRFGMDGAILFSDILVIPDKLGMDVRFVEGKGPVLTPIRHAEGLNALSLDGMLDRLEPVYEALRRVKKQLPEGTAMIGFAGLPWTLACYMIQGESGTDFALAKQAASENEALLAPMIKLLIQAVIAHTSKQIEEGADVIQLFDSWAGLLNDAEYERWVVAPAKIIIGELKKKYPQTPIIAFPRQSGAKFKTYALATGADGISVDDSVPLEWIKDQLQPICTVQGNLPPNILAGDPEILIQEAEKIIRALSSKSFVFNLGHGIVPHTPPENMQILCDYLKQGA